MDTQRQKAFDFCSDLTKQLLTLSTAIIAITITFSKDVFGSSKGTGSFWMTGSWVCYVIAIIFGIWALMALTGTLEPAGGASQASIRGSNIRIPSIFQILFFLLGIAGTVIYAIEAGTAIPPQEEPLERNYKIATAEQAIKEVKRQLPTTIVFSRFSRIELLESVPSSSQKDPVWHVQVEVTVSASNSKGVFPTKTQTRSGLSHSKSNTTPIQISLTVDYFIDSMTGSSTSFGLPQF